MRVDYQHIRQLSDRTNGDLWHSFNSYQLKSFSFQFCVPIKYVQSTEQKEQTLFLFPTHFQEYFMNDRKRPLKYFNDHSTVKWTVRWALNVWVLCWMMQNSFSRKLIFIHFFLLLLRSNFMQFLLTNAPILWRTEWYNIDGDLFYFRFKNLNHHECDRLKQKVNAYFADVRLKT